MKGILNRIKDTHTHTSLWKQLLCVKMITASERLSLASIASSLVSLSNQ